MPSHSKTEDLIRAIGSNMRAARHRARISQFDAAASLGVPARTLRSWEQGEVSQPAWCVSRMSDLYQTCGDLLLAPDGKFRALVDTLAEHEAVTARDTEEYAEASQRVSVLVTEHLRPVTSAKQWAQTMGRIEAAGRKLEGKNDG